MKSLTVTTLALLITNWLPIHDVADHVTPDQRVTPAEITLEASAPYYDPHLAIVSAGVPLRWRNPTASPHSIRHDGCLSGGICAFQSPALPPSDTFMIAPLPSGRYPYHCEIHPVMRGVLVVLPEGAAAFPAITLP